MNTTKTLLVLLFTTTSFALSVGAAESSTQPATKISTQPTKAAVKEASAVFINSIKSGSFGGMPTDSFTSEKESVVIVAGYVPGGEVVFTKDIGLVDSNGKKAYLLGVVLNPDPGIEYAFASSTDRISTPSATGSVRVRFAFDFSVGKTALKEPLIFKVVGREDQKVVILPDDTAWYIEAFESGDKETIALSAKRLKTRKDQAKTSLPALKSALAKEKEAEVRKQLEAAIKELGD